MESATPVLEADGDVGFHAALPEGALAELVGRVDGSADAIFVIAHVAVGHGDGVDVRIDELVVPGQGVGDAVDVIPAAGVEADKMPAEGGADFA